MTKLTRLFATCLLVVSISAVALADGEGGLLQGPPAPVPPPSASQSTEYTPGSASPSASEPVQDSSLDIASAEDILMNWLVFSIF